MFVAKRIKLILLLWVGLETLALVAAIRLVGVGGALLAGLGTTLIGASMLKRTSAAAMLRLRIIASGRDEAAPAEMLDGTLLALAAVALLLPGFLTDAVGLGLALAPVRAALIRRLGGGSRRHGRSPETIDLASGEWSVEDVPSSCGEAISRSRSSGRPVSL